MLSPVATWLPPAWTLSRCLFSLTAALGTTHRSKLLVGSAVQQLMPHLHRARAVSSQCHGAATHAQPPLHAPASLVPTRLVCSHGAAGWHPQLQAFRQCGWHIRTAPCVAVSSLANQAAGRGQHAQSSIGASQADTPTVSIQLPQYCCGCGIKMQQTDPEAPGYFIIPSRLLEPSSSQDDSKAMTDLPGLQDADDYAAAQEDMLVGEGGDQQALPEVLCQRCFSLRHAGRVKSAAAESQLPEFDLGKKVGRKIALQKDRRAVVLLVVDASDFDGSLPRTALKSLYPPGYDFANQPIDTDNKDGAPSPVRFKLMLALNKVDLLPKEATAARLVQWVKLRMAQAGLPKPDKVFCVSANKGRGIKEMVEGIKDGLGFRGDLWVVGAQNAGKSSVIAAMKRQAGTAGKRDPTVAPFAGTTLGLINVPGLPLGPKQRAFDTPGVPHTHQLTSLLTPDEIRLVLPGKSLTGRTFRTSKGHSILIGGLARIDVLDHQGATMYLTLFVSPYINLHLGKTEGAAERMEGQVGQQLTPPASLDRWKELPALTTRSVAVEGTAWDRSSVDIHIAGLGWVALGMKGEARLAVWVAPQVQVTTRPALIPDYSREFGRPGYNVALPSSKHQAKLQAASKPEKASKPAAAGSAGR